jgi:hypothetical protein
VRSIARHVPVKVVLRINTKPQTLKPVYLIKIESAPHRWSRTSNAPPAFCRIGLRWTATDSSMQKSAAFEFSLPVEMGHPRELRTGAMC